MASEPWEVQTRPVVSVVVAPTVVAHVGAAVALVPAVVTICTFPFESRIVAPSAYAWLATQAAGVTLDGVSEFGFAAEHAAVDAGTLKAVLAVGVAPDQPAVVRVTVVAVLLKTTPVMLPTVTVAPAYPLTGMAKLVSVALVSV